MAACHVGSSCPLQTIRAGHTLCRWRALRAIPVLCNVGCNAVSAVANVTDTKFAWRTTRTLVKHCCTKGKVLISGTGHTVVGLGSVRAISVHWYGGCCTVSADATDTKLACATRGALSEVCCTFCPVLIIGTGHPIAGGRALGAILMNSDVGCNTCSAVVNATDTKLACSTRGALSEVD